MKYSDYLRRAQRQREFFFQKEYALFPIRFDDTSIHDSNTIDFFLQSVHYDIRYCYIPIFYNYYYYYIYLNHSQRRKKIRFL